MVVVLALDLVLVLQVKGNSMNENAQCHHPILFNPETINSMVPMVTGTDTSKSSPEFDEVTAMPTYKTLRSCLIILMLFLDKVFADFVTSLSLIVSAA